MQYSLVLTIIFTLFYFTPITYWQVLNINAGSFLPTLTSPRPQILKYTPASHPDKQNLDEALGRATEVCSQVNEGVKEKDNSDKLEWIQTHVHCEGLPEVDLLVYDNSMNVIIGLCHSYSGTVVTFQESFLLLVNASFRRRHVSFVWLLLATAPIAWAG